MAKKQTEAAAKAPEPEPIKTAPAECKLVLIRPMGLGAGTRARGTVVATAKRLGKGWDPESVEGDEGLAPVELETALRNPHLLEIR